MLCRKNGRIGWFRSE